MASIHGLVLACVVVVLVQSAQASVIDTVRDVGSLAYHTTVNVSQDIIDIVTNINNTVSSYVQTVDNTLTTFRENIEDSLAKFQNDTDNSAKNHSVIVGCVLSKSAAVAKTVAEMIKDLGLCFGNKVKEVEDLVKGGVDAGERIVLFIPEVIVNVDNCTKQEDITTAIGCFVKEIAGLTKEVAVITSEGTITVAHGGVLITTLVASLPTCIVEQVTMFGVKMGLVAGGFGKCLALGV